LQLLRTEFYGENGSEGKILRPLPDAQAPEEFWVIALHHFCTSDRLRRWAWSLSDGTAPGNEPNIAVVVWHKEATLKTMTCRELGGPCDEQMTADSWDEMVKRMTAHVMKEHPQTAQDMRKMHEQDPKKWGSEMKPKWDAKQQA
jgi:predicted small metal-binding protein